MYSRSALIRAAPGGQAYVVLRVTADHRDECEHEEANHEGDLAEDDPELGLSEPLGGPKVDQTVRAEHDGRNDGWVQILDPKAQHCVECRHFEAQERCHAEEAAESSVGERVSQRREVERSIPDEAH